MSARPLLRNEITALYEQLLGRTPADAEVDAQLEAAPDLQMLLRVIVDSPEYALRLAAPREQQPPPPPPARVNIHHADLAEWAHPVGAESEDGVATVGRDGYLFLTGGTNANVAQFTGRWTAPDGWLDAWATGVAKRFADLERLGARGVLLVVPDKLSILPELLHEPLEVVGPSPVRRLQDETDLPVLHPVHELLATTAEPCMRTDSHLTFEGNRALASLLADPLEAPALRDAWSGTPRAYLAAGDLGRRFAPPVVEVMRHTDPLGNARMSFDNAAEVMGVGGHIGLRQVLVNDHAPDPRTIVVFGDSYAFSGPGYQGLVFFLAQVFAEVHFVWIPFGWDPEYVRRAGAQLVVFQGAERFAGRVPRPRVDARALAEETLARKRALGIETAFGA